MSLQKPLKKLQDFGQRGSGALVTADRDKSLYEFGSFHLDVAEHQLVRGGQVVPLTPKIFDLLSVLVASGGHLVSKERLIDEIWPNTFVEEANLSRAISVLRKSLGETVGGAKYIETVPKIGYRFVAPVRVIDARGPVGPTKSERLTSNENTSAPEPPHDDTSVAVHPASTSRLLFGICVGTVAVAAVVTLITLGGINRSRDIGAPPLTVHSQLTFTGREMTPAVSPEGARIAYVSNESPERRVIVQAIGGSELSTVFRAPEIGPLRWSPDGRELLFWARGGDRTGLFIVPSRGGEPRRIAERPFVACWSPDSGTVALARFLTGEIVFVDKAGTTLKSIVLHDGQGWIADLDWSAANNRMLFIMADRQQRPAIWTIAPDGSGQTKVVSADSEIVSARWSPDGESIYHFRRVHQTVSLYKSAVRSEHAGSSNEPPLVSGLESDGSFALSMDGRRLIYARAPYSSNLWLVEPLGSRSDAVRRTPLTTGTSIAERPRVSPDGQSIVFNMGVESQANLYTIPVAGGVPRQLTFLNGFNVAGAWSPDGQSVAFVSTDGGRPRVWILGHGGVPRPVSTKEMSARYDVVWSPGERPLYEEAGNRNLSYLDPRSRQEERSLVADGSVGWIGYPAYSPDGTTIAILWNRHAKIGLWAVDAASARETLIYSPVDRAEPVPAPIGWMPDGHSIVGVYGKRAAYRGLSTNGGETITDVKIVRVPIGGTRPELIASLPFEEVGGIAMFPDGRRFVCAVYWSRSDVWAVDNFDAAATLQTAMNTPKPR